MRPYRWQHYGVTQDGWLVGWHPKFPHTHRRLGKVVHVRPAPSEGAVSVYFTYAPRRGRTLLIPNSRWHGAELSP